MQFLIGTMIILNLTTFCLTRQSLKAHNQSRARSSRHNSPSQIGKTKSSNTRAKLTQVYIQIPKPLSSRPSVIRTQPVSAMPVLPNQFPTSKFKKSLMSTSKHSLSSQVGTKKSTSTKKNFQNEKIAQKQPQPKSTSKTQNLNHKPTRKWPLVNKSKSNPTFPSKTATKRKKTATPKRKKNRGTKSTSKQGLASDDATPTSEALTTSTTTVTTTSAFQIVTQTVDTATAKQRTTILEGETTTTVTDSDTTPDKTSSVFETAANTDTTIAETVTRPMANVVSTNSATTTEVFKTNTADPGVTSTAGTTLPVTANTSDASDDTTVLNNTPTANTTDVTEAEEHTTENYDSDCNCKCAYNSELTEDSITTPESNPTGHSISSSPGPTTQNALEPTTQS